VLSKSAEMDRPEPSDTTAEERRICREILAHLIDEPARRDTFEGIATWWILERIMQQKTETLRRATRHLVDVGYLEAERRRDGQVHYRIAEDRLDEIRTLLNGGNGIEVP
jgi:hypothetical protein